MLRRIGVDLLAQTGDSADQAFIQENQAAMPSFGLQPRDRVDERPVFERNSPRVNTTGNSYGTAKRCQ